MIQNWQKEKATIYKFLHKLTLLQLKFFAFQAKRTNHIDDIPYSVQDDYCCGHGRKQPGSKSAAWSAGEFILITPRSRRTMEVFLAEVETNGFLFKKNLLKILNICKYNQPIK